MLWPSRCCYPAARSDSAARGHSAKIETAALKKYGPVPVQRIEEMQARGKKVAKASPQEQEAFRRRNGQANAAAKSIATCGWQSSACMGHDEYAVGQRRVVCRHERSGNRCARRLLRSLGQTSRSGTPRAFWPKRFPAIPIWMFAHGRRQSTGLIAAIKKPLTALGTALEDPDPAMQYVAVASLKNVTGKDLRQRRERLASIRQTARSAATGKNR